MEIISSLVILTALIVVFVNEFYHEKLGVSCSPIGPKMRRVMLEHCPDKVEGTIIEPGTGWGGNIMALAKKYPDNTIIGYEMSPFPVWVTKLRVFLSGKKNVKIYRRDFFEDSYEDAGLIFLYLTTWLMEKLEPKIKKELRKDAVAVAGAFKFSDKWKPEEVIKADRLFLEIEIFIYKKPE